MAMKQHFYSAADTVVLILERLFKGSLTRYIDISSPIDNYTFTTEEGTAVTTIKLKGLREIVGASEFFTIIDSLTTKWAPYFAAGFHPMKFIYYESSDDIAKRIDSSQQQARTVAERLGLEFNAIFDGRRDINARYCHHEEVYITLGSTSDLLASSLQTEANAKRMSRKRSLPDMEYSQQPSDVIPEILPAHNAFVEAVIGDLQSVGAVVEKMKVDDLLTSVRKMTEPNFTSDDWKPRLLGDRPTMRLPDRETSDISSLLYPTIAEQIFPRGGEYKRNSFEVGDTIFTSLYIDIQPRKIPVFAALFNRVHKNEPFPWAIAFDLDGSGSQALNVKVGLTAMLRFTDFGGTTNRTIVEAGRGMQRLLEKEPGARLRICLSTWAPKDKQSLLSHRVEMLLASVQGWGECEVKIEMSDPAQGLVSTLPGVGFYNVGTTALPPLKDSIKMLPLTRPASPWDEGGILYRTFDGKIWPYQPASSKQESCIDVYIALPRQGKTVLAYLKMLSYILSPRNARLPYITCLDVGDPGEGFVELLQDSLPEPYHNQIMYKKLSNDESSDDSINVLTPLLLGSRFPTSKEKEAQISFLLQLTSTDPEASYHEDLPGLIRQLLDYTYNYLSDDHNPKPYRPRIEPCVDEAIREEGIQVDKRTSWWELVDALFDSERIDEAYIAQFNAAPLLHDLISALNTSEAVKHLYENAGNQRESLIGMFQRKLLEAKTAFPQLSKPTKLRLGNARIQVFNLEDVAPEGGKYAAYRTSVMYLAVSHISSGRWFFEVDDINNIDNRYNNYHISNIEELGSCIKYLYFDEVHRTEGARPVQEQMARYCSEKPKKGVFLGFSSQLFKHFDENILKNATNVHILNSNKKSIIDDAKKYWDLTNTEVDVLKNHITGRSKLGSTIFYIFETDQGLHKQALRFSASPQEIWSLSTTLVDRHLRKALRLRVGRRKSIDLLSIAFPSGSAARVIEQRASEQKIDEATVINNLVDELIERQGRIYA